MRLRMSVEQQQGRTLTTAKRVQTTGRSLDAGNSESLKHQIRSCALDARGLEKMKAARVLLHSYRSLFCWPHDEAHAQCSKRHARHRDHGD